MTIKKMSKAAVVCLGWAMIGCCCYLCYSILAYVIALFTSTAPSELASPVISPDSDGLDLAYSSIDMSTLIGIVLIVLLVVGACICIANIRSEAAVMCLGFAVIGCCCYLCFIILAYVIALFTNTAPSELATPVISPDSDGLDLAYSSIDLSTLIGTVLIVLLVVGACICIANIRSSSSCYTLLGFIGVVGGGTGVSCVAIYLDLSTLWPQFFLISGLILCVSSCCLIGESATNRHYQTYEASICCCVCPCIILLLFTTFAFIMSIISDSDTTFASLLYEYGMPVLIWLAKYISAFIICWLSGGSIVMLFPNVAFRLDKLSFRNSTQVTEFALSELYLIMKFLLLLGGMRLSYWLHSLVFADEPYLFMYVLFIEVSITGGAALTRLLPRDKQQVIAEDLEVITNSFAFFGSLLTLISGLFLTTSLIAS
jgi:hypothetical protein